MIFFDIDNTLLDNRTAQAAAAMSIYHKSPQLKDFYSEAQFSDTWRETTKTYVQQYTAGRLTFQRQRQERISDIFKGSLDKQEIRTILSDYGTVYKESWQLYPDVIPLLEKYKDIPKGIISNGDKDLQRQKLIKTGITDYFDTIVISDDIGVFKPDPDIFLYAVKQAQKQPSQCYFIGDKVDTDAKAAIDAGMAGIWINRRITDEKTEKVPEIISLNDFFYIQR